MLCGGFCTELHSQHGAQRSAAASQHSPVLPRAGKCARALRAPLHHRHRLRVVAEVVQRGLQLPAVPHPQAAIRRACRANKRQKCEGDININIHCAMSRCISQLLSHPMTCPTPPPASPPPRPPAPRPHAPVTSRSCRWGHHETQCTSWLPCAEETVSAGAGPFRVSHSSIE